MGALLPKVEESRVRAQDRQVRNRRDRQAPGLPLPRGHLRRRSRIRQYRGMVQLDSGRGAAAQGPALLSPAGREFGDHLHGLCLGAESAARQRERSGAPSPGEGAFLRPQGWPLRAAPAKGELVSGANLAEAPQKLESAVTVKRQPQIGQKTTS